MSEYLRDIAMKKLKDIAEGLTTPVKLRECPICGEETEVLPTDFGYYIKCVNGHLFTTLHHDTEEKVIEEWNESKTI